MRKIYIFLVILCLTSTSFSCKKDKAEMPGSPIPSTKNIIYTVEGSNYKVSYIDSNSVFKSEQPLRGTFKYQFKKGSGAEIGLSVSKVFPTDTVYAWSIYINGKLFAQASSAGGAYLTVPYN